MSSQSGSVPRLVGLYVYPLKSAGGIALDQAVVDEVGLRWDRRWMLVDDEGRFLSQRSHPQMALLRVAFDGGALRVSSRGSAPGEALMLPLAPPETDDGHTEIQVWHGRRFAADCGDEAAEWASAFIGAPCRIVRAVLPPGRGRLGPSGKVLDGFADAEPALVLSVASLADLNARLAEPLPMNRFRPNLVLEGLAPYGEDRLGRVRIGEVVVRGVRPCPRCALTTVDQQTARKGKEPLRTLATYRRAPDGEVVFGTNAAFEQPGTLRVGARVEAVGP